MCPEFSGLDTQLNNMAWKPGIALTVLLERNDLGIVKN